MQTGFGANVTLQKVWPSSDETVTTDASGKVEIDVAPRSMEVYTIQ